MDIDEFKKHGHRLVDWMAEYMGSVGKLPVRSQVKPGQITDLLQEKPPKKGESMDSILEDFETNILPGVTHWQHPKFFAYFPANSSPPSVLAEMLTATLGAQCMMWQTSPAATEMETRIMEWLSEMIGLPNNFSGVIQDSASSATLCALLTAREKISGWTVNKSGFNAENSKLIVYTSEESHSSTEKGAKIAGFGRDNIRFIRTDSQFAMCADTLRAQILSDLEQGAVPTCVVASIGTTGVGAVDPIRKIASVCEEFDLFLHVDAAWAGSAMIL
ncbi:MAG: pyridoxal-dependent decarboxylase, partial [Pseudomonadota bacterium]|nr:pyridoxal-dependent decarboxylase [Pseudomonadota bacterium]